MKVVAAILIFNNKILAFKRPLSENKYISLKYEFPGGKIEENETDIVALKRELKEELGIELINFNKYYETSFAYPDFEVNINFYLSKIKNLNFKLNSHIKYKLISINKLRTLKWLEADYAVIARLEKYGLNTLINTI